MTPGLSDNQVVELQMELQTIYTCIISLLSCSVQSVICTFMAYLMHFVYLLFIIDDCGVVALFLTNSFHGAVSSKLKKYDQVDGRN